MRAIHQTNTKQILKEARIFLPLLITAFLTTASAYVLSSHTSTALDQNSVSASVKVSESCAMTVTGADSHFTELVGGMVDQNIGESTISVACNDINGYSIYAVGYGNGTEGNTNLTGITTGEIIPTGTDIPEASGNPVSQSQWAMRLSAVSSEFVPTIVSDSEGSFASNHKIPNTNTKVATFTNNISLTGFSKISTTYAVGVIPYQAADTYTGQVKYTLVHPNFADSNQKVYMQDLTSTMIADLLPNVGNTFVAYDKRDNQSYKIAKLADGKYWMLDNLRLGATTLTTDLTSENTNLIETISASDWNSYNATEGFNSYTAAMFNNALANTTTTNYGSGSGKIGVYYNYCAASAGTYCYADGSGTGNASYDVCPRGWHMPTGGSAGEYQALYTAYSSNMTDFKNALSLPLSGFFSGSSATYYGSIGAFWSSTRGDGSYMHSIDVRSSSINLTAGGYRVNGFSVRCLFDDRDITDISTMQEISPAIVANTPVGTTATLTDSRGGVTKSYTVAKLADNKVWMTTNLDLPGGTTITPADSDVTENFTLPTSSTSGFSSDTVAKGYVYNSGRTTCSSNSSTGSCYSYYSYNAATAGTGASLTDDGVNASGSICPKGWRLPTATTSNADAQTNNNWETGDFYNLAIQYGMATGSYYEDPDNSPTFASLAGPGTTPGFLRAGNYFNSTFNSGGSGGYYWSSTSKSGARAYNLNFVSSYVYSANNDSRRSGFSVRCVANS